MLQPCRLVGRPLMLERELRLVPELLAAALPSRYVDLPELDVAPSPSRYAALRAWPWPETHLTNVRLLQTLLVAATGPWGERHSRTVVLTIPTRTAADGIGSWGLEMNKPDPYRYNAPLFLRNRRFWIRLLGWSPYCFSVAYYLIGGKPYEVRFLGTLTWGAFGLFYASIVIEYGCDCRTRAGAIRNLRCWGCGYQLTGLGEDASCPECGAERAVVLSPKLWKEFFPCLSWGRRRTPLPCCKEK